MTYPPIDYEVIDPLLTRLEQQVAEQTARLSELKAKADELREMTENMVAQVKNN